MFTIETLLCYPEFIEWVIRTQIRRFTIGKIRYNLLPVKLNITLHKHFTYDCKFQAFHPSQVYITLTKPMELNLHIVLCKRNGQYSFKTINMNKHKHNRKAKFINIGNTQKVIDLYTEYKLLNS